jgi:nitroreductase
VTDLLWGRRSVGKFRPETVDRAMLERVITAATWAPNHHLTEPWRFVVLTGAARDALGEAHARAVARAKPDHPTDGLRKEARRPLRAPVVIGVIYVATAIDPVVAREDRDAVAAATQNLLLAAHAEGLGAIWRTGIMVDEDEVQDHLGLARDDAIVAFVYLGWPSGPNPEPPPRRPLEALIDWRDGSSATDRPEPPLK